MSALRQVLEVTRLTIRLYWYAPHYMLAAIGHQLMGDEQTAARLVAQAKRAAGEPRP